jgi:septum site-determining protein MinC
MGEATHPRSTFKFNARSYFALALKPEQPIVNWLVEASKWIERSPGFFAGKPVVIDVSDLSLTKSEFEQLICGLRMRDIQILGVEGADPSWLGDNVTPLLTRAISRAPSEDVEPEEIPTAKANTTPEPASMLIEGPVRSGQSILFPNGDITVVGSVASGAEIIAGGSIHVYGTLRGRAIAGFNENPSARIFCHRLEAELLAINGYYSTAEELEPQHRQRSVQAWLEHDAVKLATLA